MAPLYPIGRGAGSVGARVTLLVQLSDPHVDAGPGDRGSARALEAAVAAVLSLDAPPDAVLVSGDLAEHGAPEEYARVRDLLAPLPCDVHVLAGNHDDRDALRDGFGVDGAAAPGAPLRYTARAGGLRLVVCDTTLPGRDDGALDAEARAWLEAELAAEPAAPTLVAMHHPPLRTGIRGFDAICLPDGDRDGLAGIVAGAPQVRAIIAGHVHRAAFGTLGGRGVVTSPSVHLQARLELGRGGVTLVPEPPAFAVHVLVDGELVSHVQPVGAA